MSEKTYNVLFLCTGNSARSIVAEVLVTTMGQGHFKGYSAAGESCPIWPGHPTTAHWGFEDPAAVEARDEEKRAAFEKVFRQIVARMNTFVSLPIHALDKHAIREETQKIGNTPA